MTNSPSPSFPDLHPPRPCVYLDQWVRIRLARAANGEPREDSDLQVLAAVQVAAENGVAFPLSVTHHIESRRSTEITKGPARKHEAAEVKYLVSAQLTGCGWARYES